MAGGEKTVAAQIIEESTVQATKINPIQYGKITFTIQDGKLLRLDINESLQPKKRG